MLDEPTSVLTPQEADEMLGLVRGLAHSGAITAIVISHKLKEVAKFADGSPCSAAAAAPAAAPPPA